MKSPDIKIFDSPEKLVQALSDSFMQMISKTGDSNLHMALSGGSTPRLFFEKLAKMGNEKFWKNVHFYWGDERCVSPDHPDSNFGMTKKYLFDKINIPSRNLHRIEGENDSIKEAERYGRHIFQSISKQVKNFPVFDWIILGLGEDGHTASIFPGDLPVIQSTKICAVALHPVNGQKRITLTLPVINHARRISFLVTGRNKADMTAKILTDKNSRSVYPAAMVRSKQNPVEWYLDKEAAALLKSD